MKKRLLTGFLALAMTLVFATPALPAYALPAGDPLQDNEKIIDIYINADVDSGIDPDDIKDMLMAKLEGATKNYGGLLGILGASDIRINTNMVSLDVSDLSAWYVYDHYGSNEGAVYENESQTGIVDPPESWTDVFGSSTLKRPYFAYYESEYYNNPTIFRISDYLTDPSVDQYSVAPLDQHIYALEDVDGNYAMSFIGYGSPAYNDFLFYPATSSGTKEVSFTVDSNYVNTHTMDSHFGGAGFLVNSGIDSSGYIHGYVLLYQFNSATELRTLELFKINDSVLASSFHQDGLFNDSWADDPSYWNVTPVASGTVSSWDSMMDIQLEISPDNITVTQKASSGGTYEEVLNETLDDTAYNGFGPLVQYSSHGCSDATQFRFTKLEMGFASSSSSVMDALAKANFLDDSEKYFVNLLNEDGGAALNEGDWEGVTRLRDGEIRYVTNVENPFLNDGGIVSSGAPNGSNGRTFIDYDDLDDLTDLLVAYILGDNPYVTPTSDIELTNPVAIFSLLGGEDESVATIVRDFVSDEGLDIYTKDSSVPSDGADTIETYRYKITSPSGAATTLPDRTEPASAANPLMTVDPETELGTWTVELVVVDDAEQVSATAVATFLVKEAEYYDIEIFPGAHMTFTDAPVDDPDSGGTDSDPVTAPLLNDTQTVLQFTDMEDIYVQADDGYSVPGTYYVGKGIYFLKLSDTTGVVTGTPTGDLSATLKDCRIASVVQVALGNGEGQTPDPDKYYVTLNPTDPTFEYTVVDGEGNPVPEGQAWVPGTGEAMVFGPYDEPGDYFILVRALQSDETPDLIDAFTIQGAEPVDTDTEADTGDSSQPVLMGLMAFLALAGMGGALWTRRREQE
jgi:hypothetical protein